MQELRNQREKINFAIRFNVIMFFVSLRSKALRGYILTWISGWTSGGIPGVLFSMLPNPAEMIIFALIKKLNPIA